jgi:C_GCAxxG_C_C family probable redox protein
MKYLLTEKHERKPVSTCPAYPHCATAVLRTVREKSGRGAETIEQLATVFDGGIGLSGGACGALTGGLIALGFQYGYEHSKAEAFQMRDIFRTIPRKYAKAANRLIDQFESSYGSLECEGIIQHKLQGFDDYLEQRKTCQPMIEWVVETVRDTP